MVKLLFDANISYRIKKKIADVYKDSLHVTDINLSSPAKDAEIWDWAKKNNFIIVTYDSDFEIMSGIYGFPPKVILLKIGNQSTVFIANTLEKFKDSIQEFSENKTEVILEIIIP